MIKSRKTSAYTYNRDNGQWQSEERSLIMEIPLQIWINGEHLVTLHRTPGNEFLLAAGYLFYQGLINQHQDISAQRLVVSEKGDDNSPLATDSVRFNIRQPTSAVSPLTASAIWSIIAPQIEKNQAKPFYLAPHIIVSLPEKMIEKQDLYTSTAGAHAVALVNKAGKILHCEEDVGRTNALDKIVGYCVTNKIEKSQAL